jgi:CHAT domain-containing protein
MDRVEERARALYKDLFMGARSLIRGARLLIVPHGVLHFLPFAALLSSEGRWLGEEYTLTTLLSANVLKYQAGKGEGRNEGALVRGNPDLGR